MLTKSELEARLETGPLTEHKHHYGMTVYSFEVPGKDAVGTWLRLRQVRTGIGLLARDFWQTGEPGTDL